MRRLDVHQGPWAAMQAMLVFSHARWAAALAGLALWATVAPWLAEAVGLEFAVPARLEIVDHVLPGVVMLAGAAVLATRGAVPGGLVWLGAGAIAFLVGVWTTATHVPLVPDALQGGHSLGRRPPVPQHGTTDPGAGCVWLLLGSQLPEGARARGK